MKMKNTMKKKEISQTFSSPTPVEETTLTPEETTVLSSDGEDVCKKKDSVSTDKMDKALALIQEYFNLSGKKFTVRSVTDKGDAYKLTMDNADFEITVTINSLLKHGIVDSE